ncbi:MAG: trypsin-like peptidase domain-containing protein [Phycisphaerales bacterium]|nr:trypsin-like peptidase domain-containing protein [Phycisphaerales bacterium]
MRKFITFGPALVVLLTAVVTLIAAPAAVRLVGYAGTEAGMRQARQVLEQDNVLKQIDRAVRAVAEAVEPSVVHIACSPDAGGGRDGRFPRLTSQGSGWVFDAAGHVVTNAHVVRGAGQIEVTFQDGRTSSAELVGLDPATDVAVIKVRTSEGLFPVTRATGVELHQGERVYAFGSPFGFKFSMSEGIVSGLGRDPQRVLGEGGYTNFIQTDAAVNPGNSGGPLVNVEGRLVGMNVAIATATNSDGTSEGQSSGISFAIPLSTIESVVSQIISTGVVQRGYLGINHKELEERNDRELDARGIRTRGVFISRVEEGGPADLAGLRAGDVITHIGGQATPTIAVLRSVIITHAPGDKVKVEVWRDGKSEDFSVTVGELTVPTIVEQNQAWEAIQRFGIMRLAPAGDGGRLVVTAMTRNSPAMQTGLRPGMTITAVDGHALSTPSDFITQAARPLSQGRSVKITVQDDNGGEREVEINPRP